MKKELTENENLMENKHAKKTSNSMLVWKVKRHKVKWFPCV